MGLGIETEILEFKKSTGELKEAMHSISAILNKHQYGELYFGVKADGTVVGQTVTEESLREVSQKLAILLNLRYIRRSSGSILKEGTVYMSNLKEIRLLTLPLE